MGAGLWTASFLFEVFVTCLSETIGHKYVFMFCNRRSYVLFILLTFRVADRQKSAWRHERDQKLHDEKFITRGLWSLSRHPNYVGEVMIWVAQLVLAWRTLNRKS